MIVEMREHKEDRVKDHCELVSWYSDPESEIYVYHYKKDFYCIEIAGGESLDTIFIILDSMGVINLHSILKYYRTPPIELGYIDLCIDRRKMEKLKHVINLLYETPPDYAGKKEWNENDYVDVAYPTRNDEDDEDNEAWNMENSS